MAGEAKTAKQLLIRGAFRGLVIAAEDLMAKAVDDAPIEEDTLRQSARIAYIVNLRRFEGQTAARRALAWALELAGRAGVRVRIHAEISFNTVYAAAQHEAIALMINKQGTAWVWQARHYPGGGGPKFLERNLLANANRYHAVMAGAAEKELIEHGR